MSEGFSIVELDDGFDLVWAARVIVSHRASRPLLRLATGSPDITMVRGNFAIEDHLGAVIEPVGAQINEGSVSFADQATGSILATLKIFFENNILSLEISTESFNRITLNLPAIPGESVWGGGEQMSYLQLNGRRFPMWTSEPGVGRDKDRELTRIMDAEGMAGGDYWNTNYPQPSFVSSENYACHVDTTAYSVLDFTAPEQHSIEVWAETVTLHFFAASDLMSLIGQISGFFGQPAALPDWCLQGAIVGFKDGTNSFARLEAVLQRGASISGLWCEDWAGIRETGFGRRLFWDWRWNAQRYPALPERIATLREQGVRFLGYTNPYLAADGQLFGEAKEAGFLALKRDRDEPHLVDFGEFDCGVVDFTNPAAADWFADHIIGREMLDLGLAGWMADFGEYLPIDLRLSDGSDPMLAHNAWPVLWARVNAQAIARRGQQDEAMFFMRAGYSGVQAHCPLLWAGDQCVDFSRHDGIGTVITAALSAGLVGNRVSHHDVGGYTSLHGVVRSANLLKRWCELGAFTPVMRTHEGNRPDDNLQIDSTADMLDHFAAMTRVHAALAPYVMACRDEAYRSGIPIQRPLFLHHPEDHECRAIQDQYYYGADMLVAPVVSEDALSRQVYLPTLADGGAWVHLWSSTPYPAGWHEVAAPIGSPPVFYRPGSDHAGLFAALIMAKDTGSVPSALGTGHE